jgi:hypothetical protein
VTCLVKIEAVWYSGVWMSTINDVASIQSSTIVKKHTSLGRNRNPIPNVQQHRLPIQPLCFLQQHNSSNIEESLFQRIVRSSGHFKYWLVLGIFLDPTIDTRDEKAYEGTTDSLFDVHESLISVV